MKTYNIIDGHMHLLCQTIAKVNRTYVPKADDDSHTNLSFDFMENRIIGRWIDSPKGNVIFSLNLANQCFEWQNDSKEFIYSVKTSAKKVSQIETEITESVLKLGLESKGLMDKLHYDIPNYPFANGSIMEISKDKINSWTCYRKLANEACEAALNYMNVDGEIRIWPHHFDTGIYVMAQADMGIGFGFAMKDDSSDTPYFYIAGYPSKGNFEYDTAPKLDKGNWKIGEYWKGAVLPLDNLMDLDEMEINSLIREFIQRTVDWYIK